MPQPASPSPTREQAWALFLDGLEHNNPDRMREGSRLMAQVIWGNATPVTAADYPNGASK